MEALLCRDHVFQAFSLPHLIPLVFIGFFGVAVILYAKKLEPKSKHRLLLLLSFLPFLGSFMIYPFAWYEGDLNIKEDLPLHLCRFLALSAPVVANITPDVQYGFPNWTYFSYWLTHSFLLIIPFYYVFVFRLDIRWRDFKNAYVMMNVFLLTTLAVNYILGANYMYTKQKPPVATMLDMLGPWPVYLITGQLLVLALFFIAYLPFFIKRKEYRIISFAPLSKDWLR
jgi:uncharacterized membrane protein YwaF